MSVLQDGKYRQGDPAMGGVFFSRKPQTEKEIRVFAFRPSHGRGGRGVRPDETGQSAKRGGPFGYETFPQHPHICSVIL